MTQGMVVVATRPPHPEAQKQFDDAGIEVIEVRHGDLPGLLAAMPRVHAVFAGTMPVPAEAIAAAPHLRIVARHGVGYDAVDVAALTARRIPLTITPDANAVSVAEHAMLLLLAVSRRLVAYDARVRSGGWIPAPELPTHDLDGRTLLLLGFGRIGARTARLAAAFGMRVLVHDPFVPGNTVKGAGAIPAPDLDAALAEADLVSLHLPVTQATRGSIDAAFLARMKKGAAIVNTARGALVNEAALAAALHEGRLAGAGLDVFVDEPLPADSKLRSAPGVVFTPHTAAYTAQAVRRMALSATASIFACFEGRLGPDDVVNREVLPAG